MSAITPHLWFVDGAEKAAEFYCSVFPNSKVTGVQNFGDITPSGGVHVAVVEFELNGQKVIALQAGEGPQHTEAFSFVVDCEDQDEVDRYWDALTAEGGEEGPCGWLKDRYGISWQIVPRLLTELMTHEDEAAARRATEAMLKMKKIDCAELQRAFDDA